MYHKCTSNFLCSTVYVSPRCQVSEGWSPGPAKRVIRPDDALLSSLLNFSEGEEEEESGTDEEEGGGGEGRRRHWQKQCKLNQSSFVIPRGRGGLYLKQLSSKLCPN